MQNIQKISIKTTEGLKLNNILSHPFPAKKEKKNFVAIGDRLFLKHAKH